MRTITRTTTRLAVLVLLLGMGYALDRDSGPLSSGTPDAPGDTLRVLAYNIKHGLGMDGNVDLARAARLIRRVRPDVVTLQEVDSSTTRTDRVFQARRLSELSGLEHYAFGRFMGYQGGAYGMAVLSRWPLQEATNHALPPGPEPRSALAARISMSTTKAPITIVGIHLYGSASERLAQARRLVDVFEEASTPVLLAGDFNSRPESAVIATLRQHWTVADKGADRLTFPSDTPRKEIDYVMYRPAASFEGAEHRVMDEPLVSDHRPLLFEVVYRP